MSKKKKTANEARKNEPKAVLIEKKPYIPEAQEQEAKNKSAEKTENNTAVKKAIYETEKFEIDSPYSEIHEKAQGIPEDLAEDICEAIDEAHEREEKRNKKNKHSQLSVGFREIMTALAFGIMLYWVLNHTGSIFSFFGKIADIFSPIIAGGCIAFVLNLVLIPLENLWKFAFGRIKNARVSGYLSKIKRPICLVLSAVIMTGLICGLFLIVIPELGVTFKMFADMTPEFIRNLKIRLDALSEFFAERGLTMPEIIPDSEKAIKFITDMFVKRGQQMLNTTVNVTTSVFSVMFNVMLSFVFAFYVLAQKEKLSKKLKDIVYAVTEKEKAETIIKVTTLSGSTFTKFVTGQFTEAVIIGVLCFIGMSVFRMPYAAVVSVVIGATALIPIFGAFIGAAVGTVLILAVNPMQAIWFVVFIIVLQQLESNLIYPKVVGKSIGLPGILVLASVTVGGAIFGFPGIVLGVPICSVIYCVFNEFVEKRTEGRESSEGSKEITDRKR